MVLLKGAERDEFFRQVIANLPARLPQVLQAEFTPKFVPGRNWLSIAFTSYPCMEYTLRLAPKLVEVALFFSGKAEDRQVRLYYLADRIIALEQTLEYPLVQGPVGQNWSRVGIEIISDPKTIWKSINDIPKWFKIEPFEYILYSKPDILNATMEALFYFIELTSPWLPDIQGNFPSQRGRRPRIVAPNRNDEAIYLAVEKYIEQIRQYLGGRNSRKPSEEQLCDWVQFCYLFGLYAEGARMFELVNAQELNNNWFYQRTKNYAKLCRLKAKRPSTD